MDGPLDLVKNWHDFIKKLVLKLKLPKNNFNKKCAPKLLFFIRTYDF